MGNKNQKPPSAVELSDKQVALLLANTKYTEQEIRDWHSGFIRDCPSGKLDKQKFIEIYSEFYPKGRAENYCKFAFQTFDRNNDGTIDFEEFLLSISATSHGDLNHRLGAAFDLYDISNDGQIDLKELTAVISAMYDLVGQPIPKGERDPKKRAAEIIAALDVTGDKKINRQEFIAGCKADPEIRQLLAPNI